LDKPLQITLNTSVICCIFWFNIGLEIGWQFGSKQRLLKKLPLSVLVVQRLVFQGKELYMIV